MGHDEYHYDIGRLNLISRGEDASKTGYRTGYGRTDRQPLIEIEIYKDITKS